MLFIAWLFVQLSPSRRTGRGYSTKPGKPNRRPHCKLVLEHLEDRCLPSVTLGPNFEGIDLNGVSNTPEYAAASGPNNVVEIANNAIRINDKSGNILSTQSLSSFFSPISGLPWDYPNVTFDDSIINSSGPAGRWVVSGVGFTGAGDFLDIAVSDDADPTQGFTEMHKINLEGAFTVASSGAGFNADAYVFSFNMFNASGLHGFDHVQVLTIQKSTVIDKNNATLTTFSADRSNGLCTLTPTIMHGSSTGDPMWFVTEGPSDVNGNVDQIDVVKMTNILSSTPTFQDNSISVAPYNDCPPDARQPGGTTIADNDSRILNAALRNNILVADQTVGTSGGAHARWYQFSTAAGSPTLSQYGEINPDNGTDIDTYIPSIEIDANNDLGMTFMQSSANQFMSMYVTGRAPADPSGTMATEELAAAGQVIYPYYWLGAYSAITVDPATGTSFWAVNNYDPSTAVIVGTYVANFSVSGTSRLAVVGFPSSTTAGVAGTFTVTAENASGGTATGYTGTVHFTSSDPQAVLLADYTFTAADQGIHTFTVTLKTAGSQSLTATDTTTGGSAASETGITVNPVAASTLNLAGFPSPTNAGLAGSFTLTALDPYGNVATGYTGTVQFSSSDGSATLPANYTFTAANAGAHTFSATLNTTGTQSLTATDTTTGSITGAQAGITVNPASLPASTLSVTGFPTSVTAGVAGTITVTARDADGNIAAGYRGTVHLTSSDPRAVLPANYTFTTADQGVHSFTVTLKTAGSWSVTAKDTVTGSITGSESGIVVKPAAASQFLLSAPSSVTHGVAFSLTLTVEDAYGNVVTGYVGTVHFSSSDSMATLPANYTFTAADAGQHTFKMILRKKGKQTLTVTDPLNSALTATDDITVV